MNMMTYDEIFRMLLIAPFIIFGFCTGVWVAWFVYREEIKDEQHIIDELIETCRVLTKDHG